MERDNHRTHCECRFFRSGEFADSIMSKSVTRFDYLLAKFSSRIIYVLTVFGAISAVLSVCR